MSTAPLSEFTCDPKLTAEFAEVAEYTGMYENPFTDYMNPEVVGGVIMIGGVFTGMITIPLTFLTSFGELGAVPVVGFAGFLAVRVVKKRWSYRKNLKRNKLPKVMKKQFVRWVKEAYALDLEFDFYDKFFTKVLEGKKTVTSRLIAENRRTHDRNSVDLSFSPETGRFSISDSITGEKIEPVQALTAQAKTLMLKGPEELTELKVQKLAVSPSLPALVVEKNDVRALPEYLQMNVTEFLDMYAGLRACTLSVEETYKVERAVADLQDSLNLFHTSVRLKGEGYEAVTVGIVKNLVAELSLMHAGKLEALDSAFAAKQEYVKARN